jgi:hypothetical protein
MTSPLDKLAQLGVTMAEVDLRPEHGPDVGGVLLAELKDGWAGVQVQVSRDLTGRPREQFAEWAESRITRLIESGPEPDGWKQRADGIWQLWGRRQQLPSLD